MLKNEYKERILLKYKKNNPKKEDRLNPMRVSFRIDAISIVKGCFSQI